MRVCWWKHLPQMSSCWESAASMSLRLLDAYGAVRAGGGLLISSYKINHSAASREAVGENAASNAILKQALQLTESYSAAAKTHQTVAYSSVLGASKAAASAIGDTAVPLKAMWNASAGMLSKNNIDEARADAGARSVVAQLVAGAAFRHLHRDRDRFARRRQTICSRNGKLNGANHACLPGDLAAKSKLAIDSYGGSIYRNLRLQI
jgi:hypothetical protein